MKRWNLTWHSEDLPPVINRLCWNQEIPGGTLRHQVTFHHQQTAVEPEPDPDCTSDLIRLACYFLVSQVPDMGLEEVAESLRNLRDFYVDRESFVAMKQVPCTNVQSYSLDFGARQVRPELVFDD